MSIPGHRLGDPSLPMAPLSLADLDRMQRAVLFGADDVAALRRSGPILEPQVEAVLDVWYGFVGAHDFLLATFADATSGQPIGPYLERVRARFGRWVLDTAAARFDERWLAWQIEIGRRHHRVGKNATDGVSGTAIVPFRYLPLLAQPIVDTLRPFLAAGGDDTATVDAMQNAWRKVVLLTVTLWSLPYVRPEDY